MSQYIRICLFALLSAALLVSLSCTSPKVAEMKSQTEIIDQLGRVVKLDKIPQRIISLAPSNTEILYALGLADRVVAVTDYDNYPLEVKQKPSIGGFSTPNIERVVALYPDLVLATSIHQKSVIPNLEQRGINVLALDPKNTNDVLDAISLVGKVTGKEKEAYTLIAQIQTKIKTVTDKTSQLPQSQRPRVFFVTWNDPLKTAGSGTLQNEFIQKAGGINIAQNLTAYAGISLEAVVEANPQVIIVGVGMGSGVDAPLKFAISEPRLRNTDARQNNQVYPIDIDLTGIAGSRIGDALTEFAKLIHPEIFK
jgi:iron complex transport system substrate-binding protein